MLLAPSSRPAWYKKGKVTIATASDEFSLLRRRVQTTIIVTEADNGDVIVKKKEKATVSDSQARCPEE
jgi:hypothetical protein